MHWLSDLPRPLALVLAGGASLGAIEVGMLRWLIEHDVMPDLLMGTSIGAVNAAFIAQDWSIGGARRLEETWLGIRRSQVFPVVGLWGVRQMMRPSGSLHIANPSGLERLLRDNLPTSHAQLAMAMTAVAADLLTGEKVLLSSGDLRRNVLASAAIPGVYPPVEVEGRTLVDGGIVANVPIAPALWSGAATIIVLDPGFPCRLSAAPRGALPAAMHLLSLMMRHQATALLSTLDSEHTVLYLPSPCPLGVAVHDFTHTARLIGLGHQLARGFFEHLDWDGPGRIYGHPHMH